MPKLTKPLYKDQLSLHLVTPTKQDLIKATKQELIDYIQLVHNELIRTVSVTNRRHKQILKLRRELDNSIQNTTDLNTELARQNHRVDNLILTDYNYSIPD